MPWALQTDAVVAQRHAIFIDGEAGTTGLEIRQRLADAASLEIRSIDPERRKDRAARQALMREVDLLVLYLPDDGRARRWRWPPSSGPRRRAFSTPQRPPRAPGASPASPNSLPAQADAVREVSSCPTPGAIRRARSRCCGRSSMPASSPPTTLTINAVSGYSGGGRTMIEAYEHGTAPAFELYGLGLAHKRARAHALRAPRAPADLRALRRQLPPGHARLDPAAPRRAAGQPRLADLERTLASLSGAGCVSVVAQAGQRLGGRIDALALNGTDQLELCVFGSDELRQAVLVARLDNLGKGAAGAAVQNIALMLGVEL